jgi:hypothetical protein
MAWLGHAAQNGSPQRQEQMARKHSKMCLNLRDVGETMPSRLRSGAVFRSSQLLR